jgi:hypothetical protein
MWIGVLGALLAGIVALNVLSLGLSSSSSQTTQAATALEQSNSVLRARIAEQLSNERVQAAAAQLGLVVPAPGDITYLTIGAGDAGSAAGRLAGSGFVGPTTVGGPGSAGTPGSSPAATTPAPFTPSSSPPSAAQPPAAAPAPSTTRPPAQQPPPSHAPGGGNGGGVAAG